jgi:hypothetical protein
MPKKKYTVQRDPRVYIAICAAVTALLLFLAAYLRTA